MVKRLIKYNRVGQVLIIGLLCLFCLIASIFRYYYSNSAQFLFLNWNLFLAAIPWVLSSLLCLYPKVQRYKLLVFIVLGFWILFFPNAPYILTDLIHLREESDMPLWFNLIYILSYSWTGLLLGFLSLMDIEDVLKQFMNEFVVFGLSTSLLFLAAFGIYLGRFLELNSWDAIHEPFIFLDMIKKYFLTPMNHGDTWGLTIFMGAFLNLVFWSLKVIIRKKQEIEITRV